MKHPSITCFVRELVKNKLPKFCEVIFSLNKAKNTGIAGLRRVFSTKYKGKRTSKMGRLFIANSLYLLLFTKITCLAQERIPFRMEGNLIIVTASINGQTGDFLIDTGSPYLFLHQDYFKSKRIRWAEKTIIDFNGQAAPTLHCAIQHFSISELSIKKNHAFCIDLSSIERAKGITLLGIIGYEVLKDFKLLFDFDQQELVMIPAHKRNIPLHPEPPIAVFKLHLNGHLLCVDAKVGKKKLRFGIDTGAEMNVLNRRLLKAVEKNFDEVKKVQVKGVSSRRQSTSFGQLKNVKVGHQSIDAFDMAVANMGVLNRSLEMEVDGLLGVAFLKNGVVVVDFRKRNMWIWREQEQANKWNLKNEEVVLVEKK